MFIDMHKWTLAPTTQEMSMWNKIKVIEVLGDSNNIGILLINNYNLFIELKSPFLLYIRCNRGATGIEIIDNRDTIDTFYPHK
jgi:hypothetical protein